MKALPLLLVLGGLASVSGAARPRPTEKWKLEVKLTLSGEQGKWSFAIGGSTDLPAQTLLRARVYAITEVVDPIQGTRGEDEEPLVREGDAQPAFRRFTPGAAAFRAELHSFERKPYSIRYRVKVDYLPEDQTDAITLKVGDAAFTRTADLRAGTDADYEAELQDRAREIARDFLRLEKLGGELGEWVEGAGKPVETWAAWKESAIAATGALLERNRHRFAIWAVWPEQQARMHVNALSEYLERTVRAVDEREDETRIRRRLAGFMQALDDAITSIGVDAPLDARKAGPGVAAYEKAVAPLRDGLWSPGVRAAGLGALFDLLPVLRGRRRAYPYLNAMSAGFIRVFELAEAQASPDELKDALRAHDAALRDFKRMAGLDP
jgi:hypothetical protein